MYKSQLQFAGFAIQRPLGVSRLSHSGPWRVGMYRMGPQVKLAFSWESLRYAVVKKNDGL